jgi:MFS family permease
MTLMLPFYMLWSGRATGAMNVSAATLIASVYSFAMLNMPALFLLKRSGVGRSRGYSTGSLLMTVNLIALLIASFLAGRTLSRAGAFLYIGAFVVTATALGLGYMWSRKHSG